VRALLVIAISSSLASGQQEPFPTAGSVERLDPALDQLIAPGTEIEVIASGFTWSEGPVWDKANDRLLFSDVPENTVFQWKLKDGLSVYLKPSGYTGPSAYGNEPGSNGLTFDKEGRLLFCEHGDRRVSMLTKDGGGKITLADTFEGKRFNSPNDLCIHPSGLIFFTDPPYGLPKKENDPRREIDAFGVYRIALDGKVTMVVPDLKRPNGVALSQDGKTLFVAQSQPGEAWVMSYPIDDGGNVGKGKLFFDANELAKSAAGLPDGLKTDQKGNVWCTGPGGVLVISPEGKLLGRILTGHRTANCAWGNDGSTLYLTADYYLMRIQTLSQGSHF
jgi:gluconolactonase